MNRPQGKKGGARKIGRNKVSCARYRAEGRRLKNKKLKAIRHSKRHPNDVSWSPTLL